METNFTQSSKLFAVMAAETISLTELRPRLSELVERAHEQFDRFMITRHGRVEAVLLSSEEFEGLLETLEILTDNDLVAGLAEADRELAEGGGRTLEELRADLSLAND